MENIDRPELFYSRRRALIAGSLLALSCGAKWRLAAAAGEMSGEMHDNSVNMDMHNHSMSGQTQAGQEHAHHDHHVHASGDIKRTEVDYKVPRVILVRQDGARVEFPKQLDDGHPVILDFIYTSCTSVCPVTSQVFSQLQEKLGKDRGKVHMISISIDPDYDTPARLAEYARKFHAGAEWQHYTGTTQDSIAMQKAFDVYRGDKMEHSPVTFLRSAPGKPWVRLEGFATPDMLVHEYHALSNRA